MVKGRPKMYEMLDPQPSKQHREEIRREVELNRLSVKLRASRKRHTGSTRMSALAWELKRSAGHLLKILRTSKKCRLERRELP